jgi:hypothetical protein
LITPTVVATTGTSDTPPPLVAVALPVRRWINDVFRCGLLRPELLTLLTLQPFIHSFIHSFIDSLV